MKCRPRSLVALVTLALVPALALAALTIYASAQYEEPVPVPVADDPSAPSPVLVTPLVSMRRQPEQVADNMAARRMAARQAGILDRLETTIMGHVPDASWCVAVARDDDEIVTLGHGDDQLIPASNEKILVAATALAVMGSDYRFTTRVVGPSPVDGVIPGDVYLIGGGDPVLVTGRVPDPHRFQPVHTTDLNALVDAVVAAGVTRIEGDVIGDGSRYDDEFSVPSWENVSEYNAAHYDALMVDDGQFGPGTYGIVPSRSAARSFLNLLTDQGIEVDGSSGNATAPAGLATLAEVDSAPLSEVVNDLLLTSDNMTAELVLKEIGYVTAGEGTRQAGIETVSDQLEQWGVDLSDLVIEDGSGLSRENRITCEALVTVLGASPVPLGPFMPVANQSGTLTREFVDSPVAGRLQAKTGTLNEVKALSGVVDDARFSLLLNGEGANTAEVYRPVWDAVAIAADEWSFEVAIDPEGLGPRPTEDR